MIKLPWDMFKWSYICCWMYWCITGSNWSSFGSKMAKTRSRKHRKRKSSQRCACTRALGAHTQGASARRPTPGARRPRQDNVRVVLRSGAWGQSCGGPRRSFRSILWLFSLISQLEQTWPYEIVEFSKWLKTWVLAFSVFSNYWKFAQLVNWSLHH